MKSRPTTKTVDDFLKALYPEDTELCMASNNEETALKEATRLIENLKTFKEAWYRLDEKEKEGPYNEGEFFDLFYEVRKIINDLDIF